MASKPEQEPSIEEILASIRQIISDDDQPREADIDLSASAEEKFEIPVAASEPEKPAASFASVLELTNEIPPEEPVSMSQSAIDDIDFGSVEEAPKFTIPAEPEAEDQPEEIITPFPPSAPVPKPHIEEPADSVFGNIAAEATTAAFSRLIGNIPVEREENKTMYADGRITLEDIVKDMLKPMLRDWIDTHVPALVQRLVEKELEKLARQARDD